MFQIPKKTRSFQLRFEKTKQENTETENKNEADKAHFQVPDNAEYKLTNRIPEYVTTLVEGEIPKTQEERDKKLAESEIGTKGTREAILFCHIKVDPLKVPHDQWVLHDGSSLSQGTARTILLHRKSAEMMHNWDIVYKVSPHPCKPGEITIREIYLCPVGTAETTAVDAGAPPCVNCTKASTFACRCQAVHFCSAICREEAERCGNHAADDCLREYAAGLVARAAYERERAVEAAKEQAETAEDQEPAELEQVEDPDADIDDKGR